MLLERSFGQLKVILPMNRKEAEDFVYQSYLNAQTYQDYAAKDSKKRRPELLKDCIRAKAGTPCTVVTGSKGKGSVAKMIAGILQQAHKVGLMTSPHIVDFCERFQIDGVPVSDEDFAKYMTAIRPQIEAASQNIPPGQCISPMGIQTLFALEYFGAKETTFDVFECGKGAKYDDVNNVVHRYAVINRIFAEHTRELGDTLEAIAEDKAHVINGEQTCVFVARQTEEVLKVIQKRASDYGVPLKVYGADFHAEQIRYTKQGMTFDVDIGGVKYEDITVPLLGRHQAENCALAMAFCKEVLGDLQIEAVRQSMKTLVWPGRMEVISNEPFMMLDACINPASCEHVIEVIGHLGLDDIVCIIGIPSDKDYAGVVRKMHAISDKIILTQSQNPHYLFSQEQCDTMEREGIETVWKASVPDAISYAKTTNLPIVILGTTSVVSEVKQYQGGNECACI